MAQMPNRRDAEAELNLPPGFRFHPTDDELVVHYLCRQVNRQSLPVPIFAEVDLYKFDPWDLPDKALFGQKEWYFFTPRDRKYPKGSRPNRSAGSGYWKATGADKPILPKGHTKSVGIKKALVFYSGKAPKGTKTNWIMHEYRLAGDTNHDCGKTGKRLDEWVLCRLYNKKKNWHKMREGQQEEVSHGEVMDSLVDTLSDSFQTHESEIDHVDGRFTNTDAVGQFGVTPVQSQQQQQQHVGGMQLMRSNGNAGIIREDNEWWPNLDDLQTSCMSFGPPVMMTNVGGAASQDYYFSALNSPQVKLFQTNMPPF